MDVAFVSNVVYPFVTGGAEKRIYEIGTRLAERGHNVTIYGRHFWDGPSEKTYEGMTLRGVSPPRNLYTDDGRRSISEAIEFSKDLLVPLRRRVSTHDVVVASMFPYFPTFAAYLGKARKNTPLVTTWHEVWKDYWDEYLGRVGFGGKIVERAAAQLPQYPITVSNVTAERLASLGVKRRRIDVVPNGIDWERIQRVKPMQDGFDILFAGRLIEDKNVDMLIRAFDRIAKSHNRVRLGIIGDGPQREYLQNLAKSMGSSRRISFLGFLKEYTDVLAYMRTAEVFASPSTREGFGITIAEAMAANCTVIAADHPDSAASEVVGDGGFLVDPAVRALSSRLDAALSGDRPEAPPKEIAERYDWNHVAERAESAYRAALEAERSTAESAQTERS